MVHFFCKIVRRNGSLFDVLVRRNGSKVELAHENVDSVYEAMEMYDEKTCLFVNKVRMIGMHI